MLGLYIFVTALVASTLDSHVYGSTLQPVPVTATIAGCVRDGVTYTPGQSFSPSPCEHCYCTPGGRVACAIADCFFTPCVDAVHDPTKCCPQCPNGQNCKAPDGHIIMKNETYQPNANTWCSCPTSFGFGSPHALCAMKAIDPVHIDPVHIDPVAVDPMQVVS